MPYYEYYVEKFPNVALTGDDEADAEFLKKGTDSFGDAGYQLVAIHEDWMFFMREKYPSFSIRTEFRNDED